MTICMPWLGHSLHEAMHIVTKLTEAQAGERGKVERGERGKRGEGDRERQTQAKHADTNTGATKHTGCCAVGSHIFEAWIHGCKSQGLGVEDNIIHDARLAALVHILPMLCDAMWQ